MTLVSMVLSSLKEGPDPEAEIYLDKHDEWPWYTLKKRYEMNPKLEDKLENLGYVWLGLKDGFVYDEACDERSALHKQLHGEMKG